MPLLRKQPFAKEKLPGNLTNESEVFHCKITNEIFTDYEKFFERIILCNSLVWTCSITGKPGLTYQEAVECEAKAKKHIATFPDYLQRPILFLANMTRRTRINDMNDDVFLFAKDRYFVNEVVEVLHDDEKKICKVVKVIAPSQSKKLFENGTSSDKDSDVIVLDSTDDSDEENDKPLSALKKNKDQTKSTFGLDSEKFQYVVQEIKEPNIYIVAAKQVTRKKGLYTREKCKLYLKTHSFTDKQNIWTVKEHYVKKFGLKEINWTDHFDGPLPSFAVTKVKSKKNSSIKTSPVIDLTNEDEMIKQAKKQRKEMKKLEKEMKKIKKEQRKVEKKQKKKEMKMIEKKKMEKEENENKLKEQKEETLQDKLNKMTAEEKIAYREKIKQEKLAEKLSKKEELKKILEEEKLRRKEERDKEREKKKEEKRIKEEYMKEWSKPREDMECDDLKPLPKPTPVSCSVPNELFGDAMMVVEYLACFQSLFDVEYQFPDGITIDFLGRALQDTDVNGTFCDVLQFLLTSIFQLQEEEEEYDEQELEDDIKGPEGLENDDVSFKELVKQATLAAQIPQQNYGSPLNKMNMDGFTITEILRLHFLSSGARASDSNNRFRYQQRGGYTECDDAGLEFKRTETAILKSLNEVNVFDLTQGQKVKILVALIHQLLTYVACRDMIDESLEKLKQGKMELKMHQWAEQKREKEEATFWYKKRIDERNKDKEQKKKEKEEQLKADENKDNEEKKNDETGEHEENSPENSPEDKKKGRQKAAVKGRQSARQKEKELNDGKELPLDNIDWEKLTPEDRERMREKFEKKELELMESVKDMMLSSANHPLGRDRTLRRYWTFKNIPGIFVEDQEEHISNDFLKPWAQNVETSKPFQSDNLPIKQEKCEDKMVEEKSTSSDKENDSFDQGQVGINNSEQKPKVLQENNQPSDGGVVSEEKVSDMEVDEKLFQQSFENVYEQIENRNKVRWAFFSTPMELDSLINNLNPRGFREGPLRQALMEQKKKIVEFLDECPVDILNISEETSAEAEVRFQQIKSRNRKVQGQVKGASASEFMELNLREQFLDFEERVFVGGLGFLRINDRKAWKDALEFGNYDPQCEELTWSDQSLSVQARLSKSQQNGKLNTSVSEGSESSLVVKDLSCALVQLQQMLEPKFLKPPLGEDEETKKEKIKEALELAFKGLTPRKIKAKVWEKDAKKKKKREGNEQSDDSDDDSDNDDAESEATVKKSPLERWQESLMSCTSLSQVFLHFTMLDNSITWDKSALNARCKICKRKGDDEKMLLCDGCDYGYHMYCLKPPMKKLPVGDWYCNACKPKDVAATPRKRRKSTIFDEEEDKNDDSDDSEEENSSSDDDDDDDDSEDDSDEDSDVDSDEESEEEQEEQPTKIKFLKGFKGRASKVDSERGSQGGSARSSRSNTPTPQGKGKTSKARASLEKALQLKAVAGKSAPEKRKASRHSIETEQPTRKSGRQSTDSKPSRTSSRLSLESSRGKRKIAIEDDDDDDEVSSKSKVSKNRCNEKVNVTKVSEDLVNELIKRDESWPFHRPVTKKEAPDYFDIVKVPMDFSTIRNKINNVQYSHPSDLLEDVRTIFRNCHAYNMPTAPEYQAASKLSRFFEKRCKELKLDSLCKTLPVSPAKSSPKTKEPSPSTSRRTTRRK